MRHALLFITAAIIAIPSCAQAQSSGPLTEENIRAYYAEAPAIFNKSYEEFYKEYGRRVGDNLQIIQNITIIKPDKTLSRSKQVMNKTQMLEAAQQAYDAAGGATLSNGVDAIEIAGDGKSATVKTTSVIDNMAVPGPSLNQSYVANSLETCIDTVNFSNTFGIQTSKSDFTSEVTLTEAPGH